MKGSKPLIAVTIAVSLAMLPPAIAAPKTTNKAAGRVTTVVNTILNGVGIPAKSVGINGDFYIDTKNLNLYGPKTKGVWKTGTSLKQADPKSITTVPSESGPQGDKGDKGATGNTGATGSAGAAGAAGATGPAGAKGEDGVSGAAGLPGAQGTNGSSGPAGAAGAKGDTGAAGGVGSKGDTGLTGSKGDTGLTGSKGDAGISLSKFVVVPSISLVTATDANSNSGIFFTADADGNYTFDVLVTGLVQVNVDYKLNAEIVVGTSAIISQYVVASDAITFANGSAGRQYGFHIIGVAAGVSAGTNFGVRISIQYGAGSNTVFFNGRALINKVGSIG